MFTDGTVKTWEAVVEPEPQQTPLDRFQFHRMRPSLLENLGSDLAEPPEVAAFTHLIRAKDSSHIISKIYKVSQGYRVNHYTKARLAWQVDLDMEIDDGRWKYYCESTKCISLNGRHRLIHFKFLNRVYYTQVWAARLCCM